LEFNNRVIFDKANIPPVLWDLGLEFLILYVFGYK
jgi:hypothetical protein